MLYRKNLVSFIVLLITLFFCGSTVHALRLKTGDLILESLPCRVCSLIEDEEGLPYSHIGIVVVENQKISILESWRKGEKVSLEEFLGRKRKNSSLLVLRPRHVKLHSKKILEVFEKNFEGKSYDSNFLWNNLDERGEKLYCSEFVAKLMNYFLPTPLVPKAMHFEMNRAEWIKYFGGTPPDGKPGISPADFVRAGVFEHFTR